ncbi:hypothetical protein KQI65_02155 [bacterium]|nr:hypothetical protein [bacterium]
MLKQESGYHIRKTHYAVGIIFAFLVFNVSGCREDPTSTEPVSEVPTFSSHEWTWEYIAVDSANTTGHLSDICYINDTCIWAVGWIEHKGERFNACRWDGKEWRLEKVYDDPTGSATKPGVHEIHTLYGASPDDIWFIKGNAFIHWNGESFRTDRSLVQSVQSSLRDCWASGPNNIYAGGYEGGLVHYDGSGWKQLKRVTNWKLSAMHGVGDTVLVAYTDWQYTGVTEFYTVVGDSVNFFTQVDIVRGVDALWFSSLQDVYTAGPHTLHYDGEKWRVPPGYNSLPLGGFTRGMAANNNSDILECGDFGTIRHFNGETCRQWKDRPGFEYAALKACIIRGNEAWLVGINTQGGRVLIVHGTRSS